jgi:hypothetical protein
MTDPTILAIRILANIPDGATVLRWRQRDDGSCVVLCAWREEYVSWAFYPQSEGVHSGRYTSSFERALETYLDR